MDERNWEFASPSSTAKSTTMSPGQLRGVLRDVRDPRNNNPLVPSSSSPDLKQIITPPPTSSLNNGNNSHYDAAPPSAMASTPSFSVGSDGKPDYGFHRPEFNSVSSGVKTWSGGLTDKVVFFLRSIFDYIRFK